LAHLVALAQRYLSTKLIWRSNFEKIGGTWRTDGRTDCIT